MIIITVDAKWVQEKIHKGTGQQIKNKKLHGATLNLEN